MDICWKETPKEIVNYILRLACSRLVYRDNRYIEIGKINRKNVECVNRYLIGRIAYNDHFEFSFPNDGGWYLDIRFDSNLYEDGYLLRHGLCFDYHFSYLNEYEICYWSDRIPESGPSTQIRTIMN
jgi:hypothetical protein